jgi:hypothetical protein
LGKEVFIIEVEWIFFSLEWDYERDVDWTSLKNSVLIGRVLAVKHSVTRVRNRRGVKRKFLGRNYVACKLTRDKVKGRVGITSN